MALIKKNNTIITYYFLFGTIFAAILHRFLEFTDNDVSPLEAISMILFWPIMLAIFIWNFIVGLLEP